MKCKKGIGGTDISAIVGMNPFKTPLDVFLDKTGQQEPIPDNENMWWGREMEPVLAKRYEKETGKLLYLPDQFDTPLINGSLDWYIGSPDALINAEYLQTRNRVKAEGGVDFKTSGKPDEWGEPGSDEVPQSYLIQAEWYMGLTGAQWWDIAVLLMSFTRKFAIYRINRDQELIDGLTEAGAKFWHDHILANVPPPLDGSKSASKYLNLKYPQDSGLMLEPVDLDIQILIDDYRIARTERIIKEQQESVYENQLKDIIGDCAGLQGSWGKITWKKSKDSMVFDSKRFQSTCPDLAKDFIITELGSRRFIAKFKEDL